jgi:outer membrane protein OmpA-like peptidoglycan-associated protein
MKVLITVILSVNIAFAQQDTVIYAAGKIINSKTKEPVQATIYYQSLPYGNKVGLIEGSEYRFALYDNEKYSIVVEAVGFSSAKYLLDPVTANVNRLVVQDIELEVPAPASQIAATSHSEGKVMRLDNLIFEQGKSKISSPSYGELDQVVSMLKNYPAMVIQLEGHTDSRGTPSKLMELSEDRVNAVKKYLVDKGVNKRQVKTKAFGGTQPVSRENTEEAHQMNRRVELRILQN